jgi:hypothetical protein
MKPSELFIVGLVYIVGVTLSYAILDALGTDDMNLALALGAILGTQSGAWLYHRREPAAAPFSVKASVGMLMAILCVMLSLLFQSLWGWLKYPEVSIPIGAAGTFVGPFVLYGTMQKALVKAKANKRTE